MSENGDLDAVTVRLSNPSLKMSCRCETDWFSQRCIHTSYRESPVHLFAPCSLNMSIYLLNIGISCSLSFCNLSHKFEYPSSMYVNTMFCCNVQCTENILVQFTTVIKLFMLCCLLYECKIVIKKIKLTFSCYLPDFTRFY